MLNILIFSVYLIFIYYIGYKGYKRVNTAEDLIVAGWSMPLSVVTGSLIAALLAAPFFFAAVGSGYTSGGFEGSATMGGLGTCMILGALIWTKPLRRLKGWTLADYYGLRYGSKKLGAYTGIVMAIAFGIFNAAALTVGGTYIIQQLLQIDFVPAALLFVSLTALYSVIGGLWAVAYTEIVQGALAVAGILGITIFVFIYYPDVTFNPEWWNISELFNKAGAEFWTLYLVLALGDIPAVDLGQRVAAAKSPKVAQRSMIIAGIVIIAISWIPGMLGEAFKTIYPNSTNPETLMLAFAQGYFPPLLAAIFLTAMAAMGMSTVAACYVATSGIITKNIYLDFINRNPNPKNLLRFSRLVILSSAVLGLILAVSFQKVIDLAYLAWDVIFVTIFWPIVLGPFWKRVSTPAVWASISVGLIYYIITTLTFVPSLSIQSEGFIGLINELWQAPVFSGVVISGITIVIVSLLVPPSQHVLDMHKIEKDKTLDNVGSKDELVKQQ
ncbi:sodium:solute symporter family protein [Lysinibacillus sphaericus]|uniref:Sodium:proline symporter n=2 Tax=Lysinibacillus TaxID=400634 RepID=A0A2S0JW78_LYSSH|nr:MULTISPECIES: sodium:solute symporter family protein [Lysinibacillus]AHN23372.1 sodium:proline symporter [Lysinibacillus varians]AVK95375.1 sodium:proline symporter [Lysinibacillus sphaericus]MCS1383182.1 sodium:solute symporter family protein [Lysinibacillus sphaericus]MED4546266.1 sodium:solute symporter family protein [Lysinibacillus sphaericus]TKI19370.1 sodium:solute symporter family protein [Lysinibacillus sphaericus]